MKSLQLMWFLVLILIIIGCTSKSIPKEKAVESPTKDNVVEDRDSVWVNLLRKAHAFYNEEAQDSTLAYYQKALEKMEEIQTKYPISFLMDEYSYMLAHYGKYDEALAMAKEAKIFRLSRNDVPKHNLVIGAAFLRVQQLDSASYYFNLAAQGTDSYASVLAYQLLADIREMQNNPKESYEYYNKSMSVLKSIRDSYVSNNETRKYQDQLLRMENEQLTLINQRRGLYILVISLSALVLLAIAYMIYSVQRKKSFHREQEQNERILKEKTQRLEKESILLKQESLLLKQENELNILREKDAQLREAFFRRMKLSQTIPSLLDTTDEESNKDSKHISLTEEDCTEMIHTVNVAYDKFCDRLQSEFPLLTKKDIIFCCMLKMKITMNDMSAIYCISKAAITKKKTRLKNEKFNLAASDITLDQFLNTF